MDAKHTPGPWHFESNASYVCDDQPGGFRITDNAERWFVRVDTHAGRVLNPGRATVQDAWNAAAENSKYTSARVTFERINWGVKQ